MDLNEREIERMIPADLLSASDRLHSVDGKSTSPDLNDLDSSWLLSKHKQVTDI